MFRSNTLLLLPVPPSLVGSVGTEWSLLPALSSGYTSFILCWWYRGTANSIVLMACFVCSLSLNMLSFILVPAEQLGLLLTKSDFHFPLLEEWEKLLSSQRCRSLLLSASLDPYLPPQAASLVPANNLGTCSSARVASVVDLSQIYGAFKLLDVSFSQPSSLRSAGLWETEKRVVVQACCR